MTNFWNHPITLAILLAVGTLMIVAFWRDVLADESDEAVTWGKLLQLPIGLACYHSVIREIIDLALNR